MRTCCYLMMILGLVVAGEVRPATTESRVGFELEGPQHRVGAVGAYSYVGETPDDGVFVPTIGVEYQYAFEERWAFGGVVEVEMDSYLVLDKELERDHAILVVPEVYFDLTGSKRLAWSLIAGIGIEFESHENFPIVRVGTALEIETGKRWDLTPGLRFDWKEEYGTIVIELSLGRRF